MNIATIIRPSFYAHIFKSEVGARALATQDVVIGRICMCGSSHVLEQDVLDDDSARRSSGWPTVEVVLLDVETVYRRIGDMDVSVRDVGNEACGVIVGLDAHAVLAV